MLHSQSKSKLINEAVNTSKRQMGIGASNILRRAVLEQYKMQPHFKNLQSPLDFLHTNQIQSMINDTNDVSNLLQNQMGQTTEFSKTIYKEVISNYDYVNFFKNQAENQQAISNMIDIQEVLRMQRKLKEKQRKVNDLATIDTFFKKSTKKKPKNQSNFINYQGNRQKDQFLFGQSNQLRYEHIKKLGTPQFKERCRHIEFYKILNNIQTPDQIPKNIDLNIDRNFAIDKLTEGRVFPLIKQSTQFSDRSKEIYFDFETNLNFWNESEQRRPERRTAKKLKIFKQGQKTIFNTKLFTKQQVLRPFLNFQTKAIKLNDVYDFAMKKITPELIAAYYKLKNEHYEIIQRQKRDDGLDEKYHQLLRQYNLIQQLRLKNQARKMPTKFVENKAQTINQYEEEKTHKFFENFQPVENVFLKLKKLNLLRERAMKSYKQKPSMVIIKNICIEIDDLLFKLLMLMLKGENLFLRDENSSPNGDTPFFTCSDLMNVKNKQEVERKVLQLIYGNYDKFEVQKVDDIPKKLIIETYVQERAKNNKIYDMLDR